MLTTKLLVFAVAAKQFAIDLTNVERIVQIVEICPLASGPSFVSGTINYQGEFLAVIDMRILFQLQPKLPELSDKLIIAGSLNFKVALWVDSVSEIVESPKGEITGAEKVMLFNEYIDGLFQLNDGIVLIHDLDKLFTREQVSLLNTAISKIQGRDSELVHSNNNMNIKVK